MDLQRMRYVVAIADEGSFTAAARSCFVVQSALSHQIASLERELGFPLFARTSRRVALTAAGRAFLPAARRCLAEADRAVADAAEAVGEIRGQVTLGVIPTVAAVDLPATIRSFARNYPQTQLRLEVRHSHDLLAALREGRIDVALLGLPEDDQIPAGIASRQLAHDHHVAVVETGHAATGSVPVSMAELAREPFVDFPADSPGRKQTDVAFESAGLQRRVTYEVTSPELMLDLVREGLAIALLPSRVAPRNDPRLSILQITQGPSRTEHLAWSDFNPSPAALAFIAAIRIKRIPK